MPIKSLTDFPMQINRKKKKISISLPCAKRVEPPLGSIDLYPRF